MEHPFFPTITKRDEATQWIHYAEKILANRDLINCKSFATRARDCDPTLRETELILAVVDTLLAFNRRIGNNQPDLYSVLRLPPSQPNLNTNTLMSNYEDLLVLLNPKVNKYPFADQALRLVKEAYDVISHPVRKAMYDKDLAFYLQQQNRRDPFSSSFPVMQQNFVLFRGSTTTSGEISQFSQVQPSQTQVESMGMGVTLEQVTFGNSGSNFMFGSGSGSGSGLGSCRVPCASQKPIQKSFQGLGTGNVAQLAEANIGDRQTQIRERVLFNSGGRNGHGVNVHENSSYVNVGENVSGRNGDDVIVNENLGGRNSNDVNVHENLGGRNRNDVNVNQYFGGKNGNFVNASENVNGNNSNRVKDEVIVEDVNEENVEEPIDEQVNNGDESAFWTACPYCFYMYEYPNKYIDCTLRCQTCKMAFQVVVIPSPPPVADGQESYLCCWGFYPLGFSKETWENKVSDSESEKSAGFDGRRGNEKKRVVRIPNKNAKKVRFSKRKYVNVQGRFVSPDGAGSNTRRQPVSATRSSGMDEMSVEAEEPATRVNPQNGPAGGEHENVEGNGFFEGLEDYLDNVPILTCEDVKVSDDKGVKVVDE